MHRLRCSVQENRLSAASRVTEASYLPYIEAGGAWVAEADGRIAGFAVLDPSSSSVWALFVDPKAEGLGIGRALHQRILAQARDLGCRELRLDTEPGTRAARFYRDAGWTVAGSGADGELRLEISLSTHAPPAYS